MKFMHRNRRWLSLVSIALLAVATVCALAVPSADGAVPGKTNFQGLLLDGEGDPVNGPIDFEFRLYDSETGGALLWSETHDDVDVLDGLYDVALW